VVATEKVASWRGQRLLLLETTDPAGQPVTGRPFVAVDLVSAAPGQRVFVVRGREAAVALADPENPADAAIVGLVDAVSGFGEAR
jgi:microcompartment protein CcmK/EutM